MGDAERLISLNEALTDTRTKRMRAELRDAIGSALHVPQRDRIHLDRAESDDVLIVVKPGSRCTRSHFDQIELRPLLRQAVVAIAAAVESYVAEKACGFVNGELLRSASPPKGLESIPVTMGELIRIERQYERRAVGHRKVVHDHIRMLASANPDSIGKVFAAVGRDKVLSKVDTHRKVQRGESKAQLEALVDRRNLVAHTGDMRGALAFRSYSPFWAMSE